MSYEYKRPSGKLYKVSALKWNKYFGNRGRWPLTVALVYVSGDYAVAHHVGSNFGKLAILLLSPLIYLYGIAIQGFSSTHDDIKTAIFDKSTGSFSTDYFHKNGSGDRQWNKLMDMLGEAG